MSRNYAVKPPTLPRPTTGFILDGEMPPLGQLAIAGTPPRGRARPPPLNIVRRGTGLRVDIPEPPQAPFQAQDRGHEVAPNLFVGGHEAVTAALAPGGVGITHVLNVAPADVHYGTSHPPHIEGYMEVSMADTNDQDIVSPIAKALPFIRDAIRGGGTVLVHCFGGRSRSPTIAMAHLVAENTMTVEAARAQVMARRPCAAPSLSFHVQLDAWGAKHRAVVG